MSHHRDKAVELLSHYVTLTMQKAGLKPDSDTHAELAECVDYIIAAAATVAVEEITERLANLSQPIRL